MNSPNQENNVHANDGRKPIKRPSPKHVGVDLSNLCALLKESKIQQDKIAANVANLLAVDPDAAIASFVDLLLKLFEKEFAFQKKERRDHKSFKTKFSTFISQLVLRLNIDDETVIDPFKRLLGWVLALSSCQYRPFRITATFCCLLVQDNLTKLVVHNYIDDSVHVSPKISIFTSILDFIFNGLYLHRYRDVDPYIRAQCVKHLAGWISTYPKKYLDNSYLRYIGWILSDKVPEPRHEALNAILALIRSDEKEVIYSGLRSFLDRFFPRILECASRDKDHSCQNAALELVHLLSENLLVEIDIFDSLLFVPFSKNREAKSYFAKILFGLLSKSQKEASIVDPNHQIIYALSNLILSKTPFSLANTPLYCMLIDNLIRSLRDSSYMSSIVSKETLISFLSTSFSPMIPDIDKSRIIVLYFLSIAGEKENTAALFSLVLNWQKIYSNINSSPLFKELIFLLLLEDFQCLSFEHPEISTSKEWLLAISEFFSDSQRLFLDVKDDKIPALRRKLISISTFILAAFGEDNLLVEKRNVFGNLFSILSEEILNFDQANENNVLCICQAILKLQSIAELLVKSKTSLFAEIMDANPDHYKQMFDLFERITATNQIHTNTNSLILLEAISRYLLTLALYDESHAKAALLVIANLSNHGILSKNVPSSSSIEIFTDASIFVLEKKLISGRDFNVAPLDCIEQKLEADLYALSRYSRNSSSEISDFTSFLSHIETTASIVETEEYSTLQCGLRLVFVNLIDSKCLKPFISLILAFPEPVVFLVKKYLSTLLQSGLASRSLLSTLAEGYVDCAENVDALNKASDLLASILVDQDSSGLAKGSVESPNCDIFVLLVINKFASFYEKQAISLYMFKLINERWGKFLTEKSAYHISQQLESVSFSDKSIPSLDHFIQFKKFVARVSAGYQQSQAPEQDPNILKVPMDEANPFTLAAQSQEKVEDVPMDMERSIQFPTSPLLE